MDKYLISKKTLNKYGISPFVKGEQGGFHSLRGVFKD
jgi:hypothetical protein